MMKKKSPSSWPVPSRLFRSRSAGFLCELRSGSSLQRRFAPCERTTAENCRTTRAMLMWCYLQLIGLIWTGSCVAILPSHSTRQVRGSECRDFGFDTCIIIALPQGSVKIKNKKMFSSTTQLNNVTVIYNKIIEPKQCLCYRNTACKQACVRVSEQEKESGQGRVQWINAMQTARRVHNVNTSTAPATLLCPDNGWIAFLLCNMMVI